MKKATYDAVTNSQFAITVANDKVGEVEAFFKDPGLRGRIGALLNAACNEVLVKELGPYFKLTQEATK